MKVVLEDISKAFQRRLLFSGVNQTFSSGSKTAILGPNGSGKSTLLQIIAGMIQPSKGKVNYWSGEEQVPAERQYQQVSMAAPSVALPDELTLREALQFHFSMKPIRQGMDVGDVEELLALSHKGNAIKYFSTGMQQRLKLALALFCDTPLLLLDEPCAHLDEQGMGWYQNQLEDCSENRTILVCTNNREEEKWLCPDSIDVTSYQAKRAVGA